MKKVFMAFGIALCLLVAYANLNGWSVADTAKSGKWGPHGHNTYHK